MFSQLGHGMSACLLSRSNHARYDTRRGVISGTAVVPLCRRLSVVPGLFR